MFGSTPFDVIIQMAGGYCLPRALHVVADLGVADALDDEPRTAGELAAAVGANPEALGRILRLLSAYGVFAAADGRFRHSPASRLLRDDHPQSMRALARMFGLSMNWTIFGSLDYSVQTGLPAGDRVLPGGYWGHLAEHPEAAAIFNAAMEAKAYGQVWGVLSGYDFTGFADICDVGGGRGHLLASVLKAAPAARGILFDLPHVVEEAAGLASERLSLQGGDFFRDALPSCDAYLLMEVIHDWSDEDSLAILAAVRRAAPAGAKLLVIEQMVPEGNEPHWSKMLDIHMLALLGGRQRTRAEYEALLGRAGFAIQRQIDTPADISILEAVVA